MPQPVIIFDPIESPVKYRCSPVRPSVHISLPAYRAIVQLLKTLSTLPLTELMNLTAFHPSITNLIILPANVLVYFMRHQSIDRSFRCSHFFLIPTSWSPQWNVVDWENPSRSFSQLLIHLLCVMMNLEHLEYLRWEICIIFVRFLRKFGAEW